MSYMRDQDRATRGVRAIASADSSPARQLRQARLAQATGVRDRAMARIARGALGLVSLTPGDGESGGGGGGGGNGRTTIRPTVGFVPGGTYTAVSTTADLTPKPPPPYTVSSTGPSSDTIGPAPHPQPVDRVISPPPRVSPPSGGGGTGGSTGVAMGPRPAGPPIPTVPVLDASDQPTAAVGPDNTMRNVLIAGGAAVAAYLLFFRKGSP